jgi:hypothetical protein
MHRTTAELNNQKSQTIAALKQFKEGDRVYSILETIATTVFWLFYCVRIDRLLLQWWYTQEHDKPNITRIAMSIIEPQKPTFKIGLKRVGCIYLIEAVGTNRFKVGRSSNLGIRIEQLRNQSPYPLKIVKQFDSLDCITEEALLHKLLAPTRIYGEWFNLNETNLNLLLKNHFWSKTFKSVTASLILQWVQDFYKLVPQCVDSIKIEDALKALKANTYGLLDTALRAGQLNNALFFLRFQIEQNIPSLITDSKDFIPSINGLLLGYQQSIYYTWTRGMDSENDKARVKDEWEYAVFRDYIWEVNSYE